MPQSARPASFDGSNLFGALQFLLDNSSVVLLSEGLAGLLFILRTHDLDNFKLILGDMKFLVCNVLAHQSVQLSRRPFRAETNTVAVPRAHVLASLGRRSLAGEAVVGIVAFAGVVNHKSLGLEV